ncbi:MAG: phosphopentomutase, partial [Aestuariivirgaceae bacterium]
ILLILDSVGIGGAPDAQNFGDEGADTLGHIAERGFLRIPTLLAMGIAEACQAASGRPISLPKRSIAMGQWGFAVEVSRGKDTPSGHWEIAGVPVPFDWGYFPKTVPCFPDTLINALIARAGLPGLLGNKHASGTEIISELGDIHLTTGKPIIYTSADSVIQIAAHETVFGLERLYQTCLVARELADPLNIGRVIARPFIGSSPKDFARTENRRDYAIPPPEATLLDRLTTEGRQVVSIGKIGDIFAHRGTGTEIKAAGNDALFDKTLAAADHLSAGGLVIANFVDFDTLYGHRRDPTGYALALEAFDRRLPNLLDALQPGDLLVITADHGCDPTWRGTDHTRECVPILAYAPGMPAGSVGRRSTFADIGQTIARHLGIPPLAHGTSW